MSFATVSISTYPNKFEPVNTDGVWFEFNSASSSVSNYQYLVDVSSWNLNSSSATVSLGRFKLPPRPTSGSGIFTPHKILRTQIDNSPQVPISATGINQIYDQLLEYYFEYGFQADVNFPISNTDSIGLLLAFSASNANLTFETGDILTVRMTNTKVNTGYNGTCSVGGIIGTDYIVTDLLYGTPQTNETGTILNLTRFYGSLTQSEILDPSLYVYNGQRQYDEKGLDIGGGYIIHGNANPFLTTYTFSTAFETYKKPVKLGQYETLGFMTKNSSNAYKVNNITYYGYNSSENVVEGPITMTLSTTIDYTGKFEMGVGPQNLIDLLGTASVTFTNVDFYRIFLGYNSSAISHLTRRIDTQCSPYSNVQLMFLNDVGSYEYWNFDLVSKRTLSVEKTQWKKQLAWDYTVGDRQQSVLSSKANNSYMVNTNWLNEYDYEFLSQLIKSPEAYRIDSQNRYIPIVVTDTKLPPKTHLVDSLFNLTINFVDAFNVVTTDN